VTADKRHFRTQEPPNVLFCFFCLFSGTTVEGHPPFGLGSLCSFTLMAAVELPVDFSQSTHVVRTDDGHRPRSHSPSMHVNPRLVLVCKWLCATFCVYECYVSSHAHIHFLLDQFGSPLVHVWKMNLGFPLPFIFHATYFPLEIVITSQVVAK
jgi:hypothetical protein